MSAMPERRQPDELDEIDREFEKLKGFGSTLYIGLGMCALVTVLISLLLWLAVL